jgi:hypothetical protein
MVFASLLGITISAAILLLGAGLLLKKSRHGAVLAVAIGIGAMALALLIQSIFQEIPFILVFESAKSLSIASSRYVALQKEYPFEIAAFLGIMAGLWQEGMKLFAVKYRKAQDAPWIGFGFAAVDIAVFVFGLLPGLSASGSAAAVGAFLLIGIVLQAPFSMMFHTGTAVFLKDGVARKKAPRNFFVAFLAHSYVDGMLDYVTIATVLLGFSYAAGELIVWIPSTAIALIFLAYLVRHKDLEAGQD